MQGCFSRFAPQTNSAPLTGETPHLQIWLGFRCLADTHVHNAGQAQEVSPKPQNRNVAVKETVRVPPGSTEAQQCFRGPVLQAQTPNVPVQHRSLADLVIPVLIAAPVSANLLP